MCMCVFWLGIYDGNRMLNSPRHALLHFILLIFLLPAKSILMMWKCSQLIPGQNKCVSTNDVLFSIISFIRMWILLFKNAFDLTECNFEGIIFSLKGNLELRVFWHTYEPFFFNLTYEKCLTIQAIREVYVRYFIIYYYKYAHCILYFGIQVTWICS